MKTIKLSGFALAIALSFGIFVGCNNSDDPAPTLPPIGGFNNSDEIAAADLVAKWSFENAITESKNNIAGTPTNVAYATGAKGQAWDGSSTQARYAIFNGATAIGSLNSFSFAFWMNSANTVPDTGTSQQGKGTQGIFSLVKPTEFWGAINIFLENPDTAFPNKLRLKLLAENKRTGVQFVTYAPTVNIDNLLNTWFHVAFTYSATTSKFSVYINGIPAGSLDGPYAPVGGFPGSFIAYASDPGGVTNPNAAPLWGNLDFGGTYNKVVLGSHQFSTNPSLTSTHGIEPWSTTYVGKLDEFRI